MDDDLCKKKRRLSLSLLKKKERFSVTTEEDVQLASKKIVPKNNTRAINWPFRIFEDWIVHSHDVKGRSYQTEDLWMHEDADKFSEMLSCFCLEIKQQNGTPYTPKSLLQILINLQKYAHEQDKRSFYFMNQKYERFKRIHTVLNNLLHKDGIGATKSQA